MLSDAAPHPPHLWKLKHNPVNVCIGLLKTGPDSDVAMLALLCHQYTAQDPPGPPLGSFPCLSLCLYNRVLIKGALSLWHKRAGNI